MRKLMSLLLAVVMVMSLATVAFADDWNGTYGASETGSFVIEKIYTTDVGTYHPNETLEFEIKSTAVPDGFTGTAPMIAIGTENKYTVDSDVATNDEIPVSVPSYNYPGIYKYTITEKEGSTLGVAYDTATTIEVVVFITYNNDDHTYDIENTNYILLKNGKKVDEFKNTYTTTSFTVAKNVEGNLANETDKFPIKVTLTADEGTVLSGMPFTVKGEQKTWGETNVFTFELCENDGVVTFDDLPAGVKVTVEETDAKGYNLMGYTIDDAETPANEGKIVVGTNTSVVVENEKSTSVETGIITDSAPYIILIAVCALAAVLFVTKRRSVEF